MTLDHFDLRCDEQPLRDLLRVFTYRPGWEFFIERGMLRVRATVIDSTNQTQSCPLSYEHALPRYTHPGFDWQRWLFDQIMTIERHEAQEFFQVAGVPVYDPHKGEEDARRR